MKFRLKTRTSTDLPWINLAKLDLLWGLIAPAIAIWLRDATLFNYDHLFLDAGPYIVVSAVATALSFIAFRVSHSVSRFFSLGDAIRIIKASAAAIILTLLACFMLTRLDNIPRTVPFVHLVILAAGNILGRAERHLRRRRRNRLTATTSPENIIVIGVNDLSSFYVQMVDDLGTDLYNVVALLDDKPSLQGRFVHGYPVAGRIHDIEQVIAEYGIHGVPIHQLIIAMQTSQLTPETNASLARTAERHDIGFVVLPDRLGLTRHQKNEAPVPPLETASKNFDLNHRFFKWKRIFDVTVASIALILTLPLALIICVLVMLDCGMPFIFWQIRIGRGGDKITVYKFRTIRAPYQLGGELIPESFRTSWIGRALRRTHLDELPQLLSVVSGEMSLIGPRPLLPIDMTAREGIRQAVRPGITGWAQVNGGTLLTIEEKAAMDEWYIRHASWKLEFMVMKRTLISAFVMKRDESAITVALLESATHNPGREFRNAVPLE
jgi:lipopolysaccharide/colanic/teichoic acid biosynthesis glycosyltransferase